MWSATTTDAGRRSFYPTPHDGCTTSTFDEWVQTGCTPPLAMTAHAQGRLGVAVGEPIPPPSHITMRRALYQARGAHVSRAPDHGDLTPSVLGILQEASSRRERGNASPTRGGGGVGGGLSPRSPLHSARADHPSGGASPWGGDSGVPPMSSRTVLSHETLRAMRAEKREARAMAALGVSARGDSPKVPVSTATATATAAAAAATAMAAAAATAAASSPASSAACQLAAIDANGSRPIEGATHDTSEHMCIRPRAGRPPPPGSVAACLPPGSVAACLPPVTARQPPALSIPPPAQRALAGSSSSRGAAPPLTSRPQTARAAAPPSARAVAAPPSARGAAAPPSAPRSSSPRPNNGQPETRPLNHFGSALHKSRPEPQMGATSGRCRSGPLDGTAAASEGNSARAPWYAPLTAAAPIAASAEGGKLAPPEAPRAPEPPRRQPPPQRQAPPQRQPPPQKQEHASQPLLPTHAQRSDSAPSPPGRTAAAASNPRVAVPAVPLGGGLPAAHAATARGNGARRCGPDAPLAAASAASHTSNPRRWPFSGLLMSSATNPEGDTNAMGDPPRRRRNDAPSTAPVTAPLTARRGEVRRGLDQSGGGKRAAGHLAADALAADALAVDERVAEELAGSRCADRWGCCVRSLLACYLVLILVLSGAHRPLLLGLFQAAWYVYAAIAPLVGPLIEPLRPILAPLVDAALDGLMLVQSLALRLLAALAPLARQAVAAAAEQLGRWAGQVAEEVEEMHLGATVRDLMADAREQHERIVDVVLATVQKPAPSPPQAWLWG